MSISIAHRKTILGIVAVLALAIGAFAAIDSGEPSDASMGTESSPVSSVSMSLDTFLSTYSSDRTIYAYNGAAFSLSAGTSATAYSTGTGTGITASNGSFVGTVNGDINLTYVKYMGSTPVYGSISVHGVDAPAKHTLRVAVNNSDCGAASMYYYSGGAKMWVAAGWKDLAVGETVGFLAAANSGYHFVNWTSGGTVLSTETTFETTMPSKDFTVTANFASDAPSTYSVTVYKGNWASFYWYGGSDTTRYTTTSHTYDVPAGSSFDIDWQGRSDASGSYYTTTYTNSCNYMASSQYGASLGDSVTVTSSGKYYPAEQMISTTTYQYVIEYDANGGSGAPSSTTDSGTSSSKSIKLATKTPTWSGHTFMGWAEDDGAVTPDYSAGGTYTLGYGKTELYAVWQESSLSIGPVSKQYAVVGQGVSFTATCSPSSGVSYSHSNASSGLSVIESGSTITCKAYSAGTYTFTLTASATGYTSSSTTVTVEFVPVLAFTNAPSIGVIGS